ncbi:hypothetical protein UY3_10874 [Chelonia mydas]|uniref:Uncharacterized protein n=1 Tax=Chelonia mydas TaxID=8469 RepID=M7BV00_CHEMY|nr:hypothetical protein UY3_10874 [Chelonia mydas]
MEVDPLEWGRAITESETAEEEYKHITVRGLQGEKDNCCTTARVPPPASVVLPSAPTKEEDDSDKRTQQGVPMAPITTTIVNYGSAKPPETRQEIKAYTPEQAKAMGRMLGSLN